MARSRSEFRDGVRAVSRKFVEIDEGNKAIEMSKIDPMFLRNFNTEYTEYKNWWRAVQEEMKKPSIPQNKWETMNHQLDTYTTSVPGWRTAFENRKANPERYRRTPTPGPAAPPPRRAPGAPPTWRPPMAPTEEPTWRPPMKVAEDKKGLGLGVAAAAGAVILLVLLAKK